MKTAWCLIAVLTFVALVSSSALVSGERELKDTLKVGVYDTRAIAIVYARSEFHSNWISELKARHEKAKAAGNEEDIAAIEKEAEDRQHLFHLMGFGTYPVEELLDPVRDKLGGVAEQAGVDVIVSKWAFTWHRGDAGFTDVTPAMMQLFNPSEKALELYGQIKDKPPASREEIEGHRD
jgi:hypothetical protein